jgi:hypothetical protein
MKKSTDEIPLMKNALMKPHWWNPTDENSLVKTHWWNPTSQKLTAENPLAEKLIAEP